MKPLALMVRWKMCYQGLLRRGILSENDSADMDFKSQLFTFVLFRETVKSLQQIISMWKDS